MRTLVPHNGESHADQEELNSAEVEAVEVELAPSQGTTAEHQAGETTFLWLTRRDQTALTAAALISIFSFGVTHFWRDFEVASPTSKTLDFEWTIDINSATEAELRVLDRIGPVMAERIIQDRNANGPFSTVEDLQRVHGIGPRTIQRNRSRLRADVIPLTSPTDSK